jgi:hypothetical protein
MQLKNIVRLSVFILIGFTFLVLLIILYNGGNFEFAGIYDRAHPATAVIVLCVLVFIATLLNGDDSFNERLSKGSLILLLCVVLAVYLANYRTGSASDTAPARYLPFSLWRECNFDFDEFTNLHSRAEFSGLKKIGSHYLSTYPVAAGIFALPYYLPSVLGGVPGNSWIASDLEKLAASFTVLLSIILFYFTTMRIASRNVALMTAAIYALATSSFSISSQALWQHGASQLCLTSALYCLVRGSKEALWLAYAGFPASFAIVCRPTDILLVFPIGLYILFHQTRKLPGFLLTGIPPLVFQLIYNKIYFDNFFRTQWNVAQEYFWSTPLLEGIASILFSPGRGLLIYSPIFIFSFIGMILCWRKNGDLLVRYLSVGVIANLLLYSKFFMWWGGYTYGPRLLADLSPILCLFLVFVVPLLKSRWIKTAFAVLVFWSVSAHAIGAYADDPFWNSDMDIDFNSGAAWKWSDNQLINAPRRAYSTLQIHFLNKPTTRSHPQFFKAEIKGDLPPLIEMKPSKKLSMSVNAINTGSSVWMYGALPNPGNVGLVIKWYRRDLLLERFTVKRRLRYPVFPESSYPFYAQTYVPDREGRFILELSVVLSNGDSQIVGASKKIQVRVAR